MVIAGVSGRVAGRIRTLVYLDAFVPADGQALWDIAGEQGEQMYIDGQRGTPGLIRPPSFPGVEALDPNGVGRRRLDLHPLLTLTEPVRLDGSERSIRNRTYILATRQPGFQRFYDEVKDDPAWTTKTIDTGHIVTMDDPEGLAKLLLEEA